MNQLHSRFTSALWDKRTALWECRMNQLHPGFTSALWDERV